METYVKIREHGTIETVPGNPEDRINAVRSIVSNHQFAKIDGHMVDAYTASAIVQVYDNLNDDNRKKYATYPVDKMAAIAWKLLKKVSSDF